ncbi:hypothetical protein SAMN06297251_108162 [Fulvimarina manganoxydans]|uniref:Uncharacterized protein n=1 Tax=Fulvimarina manganoxydans TaxID=937218 RepID=A0A1W2C543_9HYPH|nr:hypothetical protein [Fulvimarina manganoxydans]SMC80134.1 hypothetical protein SAMN06297251_108162 [Fulvimarina manganoxydans]
MRFKRWPRVEAYVDTSRKRAAFHRSQKAKRNKFPLLAPLIAEEQHDVDTEMARRADWWPKAQQEGRDRRAANWRRARARLFAHGDNMRGLLRQLWRECPYPADPACLLDLFHQIDVGRVDPERPPWKFHRELTPRITPNPENWNAAFRQIGHAKVGGGPKTIGADKFTFIGNLSGELLFITSQVRLVEPNESFYTPSNMRLRDSFVGRSGHYVVLEVSPSCSDEDLVTIERLAREADKRSLIVTRKPRPGQGAAS